MNGWLVFLGYSAAWLGSAVWSSRRVTVMINRCHGEPRGGGSPYNWGYTKHYCREYCQPTCWRPNDAPSLGQFALALVACIIWPLTVPAVLAYTVAIQPSPHQIDVSAEIARLEREVYGREQS